MKKYAYNLLGHFCVFDLSAGPNNEGVPDWRGSIQSIQVSDRLLVTSIEGITLTNVDGIEITDCAWGTWRIDKDGSAQSITTPFPAFTFSTESIQVVTPQNVKLDVVPSGIVEFDTGQRAHFKPTAWGDQIVIRIVPRNTVIGIADLEVNLIDYDNEDATVVYEMDSLESENITNITKVEASITALGSNPLTFNPLSEPEVISFAKGTPTSFSPFDYQKQVPLTIGKAVGEKLYMRVKFRQRQGHTPVFRNAVVFYN